VCMYIDQLLYTTPYLLQEKNFFKFLFVCMRVGYECSALYYARLAAGEKIMCIYSYVCMYMGIYMYACMGIYMYACMGICMYACMGIYMYACMGSNNNNTSSPRHADFKFFFRKCPK
jgi:hypothetical protein